MANGDKAISNAAINAIRVLVVVFIVGGVGLAVAQGLADNRLDTVEHIQDKNQEVIDSVDVMQRDISEIQEDLEDLNTKVDNLPAAVLQAIVSGNRGHVGPP